MDTHKTLNKQIVQPKVDLQYLSGKERKRQASQTRQEAHKRYVEFKNQAEKNHEKNQEDIKKMGEKSLTMKLREKKDYTHKKRTPAELAAMFNKDRTAVLLNDRAQRIIQDELFKDKDPYENYKKLVEKGSKVTLHHASGTVAMKDSNANVIKFRMAGSGFTTLRQDQNGIWGTKEKRNDELIANKYIGNRRKDFVNVRERTEEVGTHTKKVFNLSGPSTLNKTDDKYYSTKNIERIVNVLGIESLDGEYSKWKADPANRPNQIRIMVEAHSRSAAAVPVSVMALMNSAKEKYPKEFTKLLFFDIIQYDPVPGSLHDHNQKVNWKGKNERELTGDNESGMKLAGLGGQFKSTVVYSLRSGKKMNLFTPQLVRGAERIILSTRDHAVGQNIVDETQYKDSETGDVNQEEKMHRIAYTDASTGQVYRGSGLNDLPKGVYIADENNVLVRLNKPEDAAYFIAKMTGNYKKSEFMRKYSNSHPSGLDAWPEDQPVVNEQSWYLKEKDRAAVVTKACEMWFEDNKEQKEGEEPRIPDIQEVNGNQEAEIKEEKKDISDIIGKYKHGKEISKGLEKYSWDQKNFAQTVTFVQGKFQYYNDQIKANITNSVSAQVVLDKLNPLRNELDDLSKMIQKCTKKDGREGEHFDKEYAAEKLRAIDADYSQFKDALTLYNREHALTTTKGFFKSMWGKAGMRRNLSKKLANSMESGSMCNYMWAIMAGLDHYRKREKK